MLLKLPCKVFASLEVVCCLPCKSLHLEKCIPKCNNAKKALKKNHFVMLDKIFSNVLKKEEEEVFKKKTEIVLLCWGEREIFASMCVFEHYELYTLKLSCTRNI